jgi:hypothetical protein
LIQVDLEFERIIFPNRTADSVLSMTGRLVKFNRTTIVVNADVEALIDIGNNVQVNWMVFVVENLILKPFF